MSIFLKTAGEVLELAGVMALSEKAERDAEIAARESTPLGSMIAVPTGISLDAIDEHGPLGGPNSEARKVVESIGKLFGC